MAKTIQIVHKITENAGSKTAVLVYSGKHSLQLINLQNIFDRKKLINKTAFIDQYSMETTGGVEVQLTVSTRWRQVLSFIPLCFFPVESILGIHPPPAPEQGASLNILKNRKHVFPWKESNCKSMAVRSTAY